MAPVTNTQSNFRNIEDPGPDVWEQYPIASWTVAGSKNYSFPIISFEEVGGSRIVRRQRPYRNGAKLDSTGANEKVWSLVVKFANTIEEPGQEANGVPLYPDVLRGMLETTDLYNEETGDLVVPQRGPVRGKLEGYRWVEQSSERNTATVDFTFVEDNEDNVDANSYTFPTVQANTEQLSAQVFEAGLDLDAFDTSLLELQALSMELAELASAPANMRADFLNQVEIVLNSIDTVNTAFSQAGKDGRDQFTKPESSEMVRLLLLLKDSVSREKAEARRGLPQLVSVVFNKDRSLLSVATEFEQSFEALLEANSTLDPMQIPKNTPIKIFGS